MNHFRAFAALILAIGVGCGAFGAHALRDIVSPHDMAIWEKGVLYHLVHGLAALQILSLPSSLLAERNARLSGLLFLVSIVVFSGSLYALVGFNQRWLGMVTPLGGIGFIAGWLILARGFLTGLSYVKKSTVK